MQRNKHSDSVKSILYDYSKDYEELGIPLVKCTLGDKNLNLILDTGATSLIISDKLFEDNKSLFTEGENSVIITTASGNEIETADYYCDMKINDMEFHSRVVLLDQKGLHNLTDKVVIDGLLGYEFLHKFKITIDTDKHILYR